MKRNYASPQMQWFPIYSSRAVADVCWAHANNRKPFYYNTYGTGYAELYAIGSSCNHGVEFDINYIPESMSAEDKALADADMQAVIARVKAELGNTNNVNNYKGSPFASDVDPSWS